MIQIICCIAVFIYLIEDDTFLTYDSILWCVIEMLFEKTSKILLRSDLNYLNLNALKMIPKYTN